MKKVKLHIAYLLVLSCFVSSQYGKAKAQNGSGDVVSRGYASTARTTSSNADMGANSAKIVYQDWHDSQRGRDIPIKIYLPKNATGQQPVVIFSHGLGGSREAAAYLGEYWSQHGYVSIFVQHAGSDSAVWQAGRGEGKEGIMQRMRAAANGKNLVDRAADVKFVLDELETRSQTDPDFKNRLDLGKIAVAGHSFGAGTALAIAGQNFGAVGKNLKDRRVKAAIYLCPPVSGTLPPDQAYATIQIPGMLLTGTEDNSPIRNTTAADRRIPYDGIKAPHQYLINFVGADHGVFGGRSFRGAHAGDEQFHNMIDKVTTEFLDATLKGDRSAWQWLDSTGVTSYLTSAAMVEKK